MTTAPETPTPTPTPTTHLASLAAALDSNSRAALARTFAELAEEALVVCEQAPTQQLRDFWLRMSEKFHYESQKRLPAEQAQPKRHWWSRAVSA